MNIAGKQLTDSEMMGEKFSSFVDGELTSQDLERMVVKLGKDRELKKHWERYQLIGDVLKSNLSRHINRDFARRIMKVIEIMEFEPATLASRYTVRRYSPLVKQISGLAIAASVMVVAGFIMQSLMVTDDKVPLPSIAKTSDIHSSKQIVRVTDTKKNTPPPISPLSPPIYSQVPIHINKYLVNHNQHAMGIPMGIHGVLPYARMIGYNPPSQDE